MKLNAIMICLFTLCLSGQANARQAASLIAPVEPPRIQLAILLDTSSSMNGLINQTRNQLWRVVNEFSRARRQGLPPNLEVAVYEYGNSSLNIKNGYIRQITPFTRELDTVSEGLFALRTGGGDEYCGYVIQTALHDLQWSQSNQDIKAIFIAGNEPFSQGPVDFHTTLQEARQRGIVVNTIHAGDYQTGAHTGWRLGAQLAGGDYMNIDQDHQVAQIPAPQDKELAELNARLNQTYLPYGQEGRRKAERQVQLDSATQAEAPALLSSRIKSKVSGFYHNENWDLIDADKSGHADVASMDPSELPEPMQTMTVKQRKAYLQQKARERAEIQQKIRALSQARDQYITRKRKQLAEKAVNTVDDAMISSVRKQGTAKNFVF